MEEGETKKVRTIGRLLLCDEGVVGGGDLVASDEIFPDEDEAEELDGYKTESQAEEDDGQKVFEHLTIGKISAGELICNIKIQDTSRIIGTTRPSQPNRSTRLPADSGDLPKELAWGGALNLAFLLYQSRMIKQQIGKYY